MKLSIKSELVYSFAEATQIIANIEGSHTSDQVILSEFLDIQPPKKIRSDKTPYGDRSIRASLSGKVTIRYVAEVENNLRQLLPRVGRQQTPSQVLHGEAVHRGIQHRHGERVGRGFHFRPGFFRACSGNHRIPQPPQVYIHHLQQDRFIINNQNSAGSNAHWLKRGRLMRFYTKYQASKSWAV